MSRVSHNIDRLEPVFDDESLVADAGLLTASTLMDRLGLEDVVDSMVRLAGGARPGRKVLTLAASMLLGVRISTTPTGCGLVPPGRCCRFGRWLLQRWGLFCGL